MENKLSTRKAAITGGRGMSSSNADHEILQHNLDKIYARDNRPPSPEPSNVFGVQNVPVTKTWIGGTLIGNLEGMTINTLNQSSIESLGPKDMSLLSSEIESSVESLGSNSQRGIPKFDSKTKSKFYNSILRLNPALSPTSLESGGKGSPKGKYREVGKAHSPTPGSPQGKIKHAMDMQRIKLAEEGGIRRGSKPIIAWPDDQQITQTVTSTSSEDREESAATPATALPLQTQQGHRLILNTPILLPNIKSTLSAVRNPKAPQTKHIALKIRPRTSVGVDENNLNSTFMNSTFQDGNANMSQRRHKVDASYDSIASSSGTHQHTKKSKRSQRFENEPETDYGAQHTHFRRPSDGSIASLASALTRGSWADVTGREGNVYDVGPVDSDSKDMTSSTFSKKQEKILQRTSAQLQAKQIEVKAEITQVRSDLLHDADAMVASLPMTYLYSKPKLRHYALKAACAAFTKMTTVKIRTALKRALKIWKEPPVIVMNEMQVGFMVISKRLLQMYRSVLRAKFSKWAFAYSGRFQEDRKELPNHAAKQIQLWWRDIRVTSRQLFKTLWTAVKLCLQRRQAIKHMIEFEQLRRKSIMKMHRVVQKRRRIFYAARSIIRDWLWFKLFRKTQTRLTRLHNVRVIQRFYRMKQCRHRKELHLITNVLRYGGYSRVFPKIPVRFIHAGFLQSINMVAGIIQRAWFTSKGNYAAFIVAAARRAKEEHLQMLNDNAVILQHNWRGTLWKILNTTAIQWNRARRISRAFRHYQYRCWIYPTLVSRRHRYARIIQRWLHRIFARRFLKYRFKARKAFMMVFKRKQWEGAIAIQREYRAYKERERLRIEAFKKLVEMQRNQAELVMKNIMKIQRVWRKHLRGGKEYVGNQFARHIYLVIWRYVRKQRRIKYDKAVAIQRFVRPFIVRQIKEREENRIDCANVIWRLGKAYCIKLAIWDRIMAKRRIQRIAANLMKKNLRLFMFYRHIKIRGILRKHQKHYIKFRNEVATKVQRWFKRKWAEYFLPVREAARLSYAKKVKLEQMRLIEQRRNKYARILVRFFTPWNGQWIEKVDSGNTKRSIWRGVSWSFMRLVKARAAKEARYYVERKAAKKMQKFCKKVIAWTRFDKIAAYRKKAILERERIAHLVQAANVIGTYWYRLGQKKTLNERFKLRRRMIDEYNRLEKLKLDAFADRDEAYRLKKITDDNMIATINASWKQGSDVSGKNYYYNYVTGETSWDPPAHYKAPVKDTWLRQVDDKGTVYYYNMFTGESSWLPPCMECGEPAERYCGNCKLSYCEKCHEHLHGEDANEEWQEHVWSLTEYSKEELLPGEIYCQECKKRAAAVTCTLCWDHYCKDCFKYTHAAGNLKYHPTKNYHKAKKGWMCIKSKSIGEPDYYVNGSTGVTTYEKPLELYTADEKLFYEQFIAHKTQSETFIEQIKTLQFELEDTKYERDVIFQRALESGTAMADVLKRRKEKKKLMGQMFNAEEDQKDTIQEVSRKLKPSFWSGITQAVSEYKTSLLAPAQRKRGAAKSAYMKQLLDSAAEQGVGAGSPSK